MKMMSSTKATSMNGVTLMSAISTRSSPSSEPSLIATALLRGAVRGPGLHPVAVEIARQVAEDLGRGVGEQRPISGGGSRKAVEDHHGGYGRHEADGGREQRLGDAGRHDREIAGCGPG